MEHLIALADALDMTVAELVAGTEHQDRLGEWVSWERFEASEQTRLTALKGLEAMRAVADGNQAEASLLRTEVEALTARTRELEALAGQYKFEADRADALSREADRLRHEKREALVERDKARAAAYTSDLSRDEAIAESQRLSWMLENAQGRIEQLRMDLIHQGQKSVAVTAVASILAGIGGGIVGAHLAPCKLPAGRKTGKK